MNVLNRHIASHILSLTSIVALALVAIYSFVSFVAEIDDTGEGSFGVVQLMLYSAMLIPTAIYTLMPIIAMLGTLMGLGTLAGQGELTAMRAAGVSLFQIGRATLLAGLVLGVLSLLLGDWLAPWGTRAAETYRSEARFGVQPGLVTKPLWMKEGDRVFNIQRVLAEDHVEKLQVFALGADLSLSSALTAEEARYENGHWQLKGVQKTEFGDGMARRNVTSQQVLEGNLSPEVLRLFVLESDALTLGGLWRLIAYLDDNGLDSSEQRLAMWRKLVAPLTVLAMMLFAIPFVLGTLRDAGAGQRLFVGILVGVGFYLVNEVTASLGQLYSWSPWLSAGLPTLLLAVLAGYRLSRVR